MRQAAELLGFVSLATGLHLAAFALTAPEPGTQAAGAAGGAAITLAGAPPELLAEWERAPEPDTAAPALAATPETPEPEPLEAAPDRTVRRLPDVIGPEMPHDVLPITDPPPPAPAEIRKAGRETPRPEARPDPQHKREAAVRPRQSEPAAPAQTASGQQGGAAAGATAAVRPTLTRGERQSLMAAWGGRIRARVERSKQGVQGRAGRVVVELTVTRRGSLAGVRILQGSGDARLDRAALAAVRRAGRFPPAPKQLPGASFPFRLPIRFEG